MSRIGFFFVEGLRALRRSARRPSLMKKMTRPMA